MADKSRWRAAQDYERGYWQSRAREIAEGASGQLDWYQWRADQLRSRLTRLGLAEMTADTVRILEVGSGPIGVATYYPGVERLLVDPLEEYYASIPALCALRSTSAVYRTGVGEALPCDTGRYDLAIIENCIDHVQDMDGVMRELVRVTRPGGILYLTVNCRTRIGFVVHRILSRLMIDRGHPHTFTPAKLGRLLTRYGFAVLDLEIGSYDEAKAEDWCSTSSRARLKARLGISEFVASAIARRATT